MQTNLFTRNYLKGVSDGLIDQGALAPWGDDKIATEVFDKIASDHNLPAILSEQLPDDVNISLGRHLQHWSKVAHEKNLGAGPTAVVQAKHASLASRELRAASSAAYYMDKAAEDGALNGVGENTPEAATANNAIARLDQANRSTFMYLVGMGNTDMPEGGVVGRQMAHPMAPKGPAINNSLTGLDKQASESDFTKAANFIEALMKRGAQPTVKMVLAAASMAEGEYDGLELMTDIVRHVKTAEELDGALDDVNSATDEASAPPNPQLVELIEKALAHYFETHPDMAGAHGEPDGDEAPADPAGEGDAPPAPMEGKTASTISGPRNLKEVPKALATGAKHIAGKAKDELSHVPNFFKTLKNRKDLTSEFGKDMVDRTLKEHGKGALRVGGAAAGVGALGAGAAYAATRDKKKEAAWYDPEVLGTEALHREGLAPLEVGPALEHADAMKRYLGKAPLGERALEGAKDVGHAGLDKVKALGALMNRNRLATAGIGAGVLGLGAGGAYLASRGGSKEAQLLAELSKAATDGALNDPGTNTPAEAAAVNANARLDMQNRRPEEYLNGVGDTAMPNKGHLGESMPAPKGPAKTNPQTTPVKEASFEASIRSAGEYWGPKLPASMPVSEKRAHVIALAGMPEAYRANYVRNLG